MEDEEIQERLRAGYAWGQRNAGKVAAIVIVLLMILLLIMYVSATMSINEAQAIAQSLYDNCTVRGVPVTVW